MLDDVGDYEFVFIIVMILIMFTIRAGIVPLNQKNHVYQQMQLRNLLLLKMVSLTLNNIFNREN